MHPSRARANLLDAVAALTRAGVRPFLVDGTLLGAVREHGFIGHDLDIDLGLFIEDLRPGIVPALVAAGFTAHKTYGAPARGLQFSFKRHQIKLDLFCYYLDPVRHERFHAAWLGEQPIRYGYPTFDLAPLLFLGATFLAPADPVAFLVTKYGPDWRVPVTPWDWAWGPKNATEWIEAIAEVLA